MRTLVLLLVCAGCTRPPLVVDVSCPRQTKLVVAKSAASGECQLPSKTRHGPSWDVTDKGVRIEGYDHGALAGPWARYNPNGELGEHGYRPGVTDSTEPNPDVHPDAYDSPATTGKLVVPARVSLFPVEGDVAFSAGMLLSADGKGSSSFIGALIDLDFPARARLRYRRDAYQAFYVSYGAAGALGAVNRSSCDDPTITGSGGLCGTRWLAGPVIRVGYARSTDSRPHGSVPSLLAYGKLAFLLGQDRWSSAYSTGNALVWRARAGVGYTALGSLLGLARDHAWAIVPLLALVEHAEAYVELGGDGGQALGIGGGIDVGFGL